MTPNYFLLRRLQIMRDHAAPLQDEAAASIRIPDEPQPPPRQTRREDDAAADRYSGWNGMQRDRRDR